MVRTRSETNLNQIFSTLCDSPEVRPRTQHRRGNPPLPLLKPLRSNSCSDLPDATQTDRPKTAEDPIIHQSQTLDVHSTSFSLPLQRKLAISPYETTAIRLTPMESTGFNVQTIVSSNCSTSRLEDSPSPLEKKSSAPKTRIEPLVARRPRSQTHNFDFLLNSEPVSPSWKSLDSPTSDYTNRLRDRMNSRVHLRKAFLS